MIILGSQDEYLEEKVAEKLYAALKLRENHPYTPRTALSHIGKANTGINPLNTENK